MARSWFTLREYGFQVLALFRHQGACQPIKHERDELVNAGQGSAQFVRDMGEEFILELKLLTPAHVESGQQCLALDRITHGACQLFAVEIPFDQVVLHALMDRAGRQFFVVLPGEHDDGHAGRLLEHLAVGFRAVTVGKIQVEQHHGRLGHDH